MPLLHVLFAFSTTPVFLCLAAYYRRLPITCRVLSEVGPCYVYCGARLCLHIVHATNCLQFCKRYHTTPLPVHPASASCFAPAFWA